MDKYNDGRYKLIRYEFIEGHYLAKGPPEYYRTKGEAMGAFNRAHVEDAIYPDLVDTKREEYVL